MRLSTFNRSAFLLVMKVYADSCPQCGVGAGTAQETSRDPMSTLFGRKCRTSPENKMRLPLGTIVLSSYDQDAAG